ncbi:preprotein translocase subunit SecG [Chlorobaculum limnaeum]|uniref:Protein-export membrane protein SecG n=1 Tax=Chlorobaculum limnaeum TaxID=274537 RepID=A0A1D8D721_CHLLM|nr:preprotein translocase subunit SecG [Chlorobaculum limnaeum]AOS83988.1 preprotein translocase subunit SecG [Chlorobaculum limnaeum]
MLNGFIVILAMLAALLLIVAVLLQSPKAGSGLTGGISSLGTVQTLGVRRTGDFLSKTSAILAGLFMVLCFIAQFTLPARHQEGAGGSILQKSAPASLPAGNLPQSLPTGNIKPEAAPAEQPAAPAK